MKFSVNQEDLQKLLNYCQGVIEKRSTLPILSNILINVNDSKLTIIEAHNKAVKDIEETSWNTDLMDGQSRFILFTDDGKPIYPDEALYKRHLPIISNPRLGFMKGVK